MKKNIYFTVGPSQLYPTVKKHIYTSLEKEILSLNHRSRQFEEMYTATAANLREIFHIPDTTHIFFTGSALEGMERVIQNCVSRESVHFIHGEFSKKFYQFAIAYQKKAKKIEVNPGEGLSVRSFALPEYTELIALTHNETSTGTIMTNEDISYLRLHFPSAIIAIDMVSSVPCIKFDFRIIDVAFFSVQKGFGLPAGLGVLLVNEHAMAKAAAVQKAGKNVGSYHSFSSLLEKAAIGQTPETPNVLGIYLLGKVTRDMLRKGIETIQSETEEKAAFLYNFFDSQKEISPFVNKGIYRSPTTLVIDVKGKTEILMTQLRKKGLIVSSGYGPYKKEHIRIGNFPSLRMKEMQRLTTTIERILHE